MPPPATRRGPVPLSLTQLRHPADPHRQNISAERVVALAQDIAVNGQLQAIAVRGPALDATYEIVYGDRRAYALEHLRRATIDAYVYAEGTDVLAIRAAENLFHEPLDPVEEARIVARFVGQGDALPVIASRMGHTVHWCAERAAILEYPADVQAAIAARALPLSVAAVLLGIDHAPLRTTFIDEAVRTGASAAQARAWVAHYAVDGARMIANNTAIEVIVREAEQYKIHVECEGCHGSVDITATRTLRFCTPCLTEIAAAAKA